MSNATRTRRPTMPQAAPGRVRLVLVLLSLSVGASLGLLLNAVSGRAPLGNPWALVIAAEALAFGVVVAAGATSR